MIIPASLWDVLGDALCFKHLVGKLLGAVCVYHSMNSMAGAMRLLRQHKICKFEYKFSPGHPVIILARGARNSHKVSHPRLIPSRSPSERKENGIMFVRAPL